MKKILKWIGIVLGGLIGLLIILFFVLYGITEYRLNKVYDFPAESLQIPTDAGSIAQGKHLVQAVAGCRGCHGDNLAGQAMINQPPLMTLYSANLTPGKGSATASFSNADWVRAFRQGVGPDGKTLLMMPSANLSQLSDSDLADIIAYLKTLPPVDNQVPPLKVGPVGHILIAMGQFNSLIEVDLIDHSQQVQVPAAGVTAEYGHYLVTVGSCGDCHGEKLAGLKMIPGGTVPSANLTPAGPLQSWTEADFLNALHNGVRPDGTQLIEAMPWKEYGGMTDDELKAIWLYLKSLPPEPTYANN